MPASDWSAPSIEKSHRGDPDIDFEVTDVYLAVSTS